MKKTIFFSIARHFENCYDKKKPPSYDNYTTIDWEKHLLLCFRPAVFEIWWEPSTNFFWKGYVRKGAVAKQCKFFHTSFLNFVV